MPRCAECRRRVGLLGITCRCGSLFCAAHALAEAHGCDFDYRSAGRASLAKKAGLTDVPPASTGETGAGGGPAPSAR